MKQITSVVLSISEVMAFERQKIAYKPPCAMSQKRMSGTKLQSSPLYQS